MLLEYLLTIQHLNIVPVVIVENSHAPLLSLAAHGTRDINFALLLLAAHGTLLYMMGPFGLSLLLLKT